MCYRGATAPVRRTILVLNALNPLGLSAETLKYQLTGRCPKGHFIIPPFRKLSYSANGNKLNGLMPLLMMPRSAIAECPVGHETWSVFASHSSTAAVQPSPAALPLTLLETDRSEDDWYVERRSFDNARGTSDFSTTIAISRSWKQTLDLDKEVTNPTLGKLGIKVADVVDAGVSVEQTIKRRYSVSDEREEAYTTTLDVKVPVATKRTIELQWKRVWQHVFVVVQGSSSAEQIPFKVLVDIRFDTTTLDERIIAS
jgi:hypothetical protein